ncbi:hypothetical protein AVHY2522_04055 [Acidovorax sp. SUPP2522]|nr:MULTISPECIES: hypothetical protein [unclassified Acidovorax]WCM99727.1 hypothetical protein M5C96_10175 [Acidovorax sp. GBBC 1281]GKT14302.1 hypothetical protein AVHY2522_04055 [Acidovorax sp. SUPP2522]
MVATATFDDEVSGNGRNQQVRLAGDFGVTGAILHDALKQEKTATA